MLKILRRGGLVVLALAVLLWLANNSLFVSVPEDAQPRLLSHRGVHQTFSQVGLENDTCTAERIYPLTHDFIENTIASMRAAFHAGADVVEIDVHLTPDGVFVVFHDWTLECRTEGEGVTERTPMRVLRTLDIGYGYTADGGQTYPLRGTGVGLMPTLEEVFEAFPEGRFLINFKSRRVDEGEELAALLAAHPAWREATFGVYGGGPPTRAAMAATSGLRGYDDRSELECLTRYIALGWSGYVPEACRDAIVVVPSSHGWLLWGWPRRFERRMREAGTEVILLGDYGGGGFTSGIDNIEHLDMIPRGFGGYVWTNRIEVVGPAFDAR